MSEEARGDGFYVDAAGFTRSCRTHERVERLPSALVKDWAQRMTEAMRLVAEGRSEAFLELQMLRDEMEHWCAPDPRAALIALRNYT